jgi:predicted nucleotidyltransferase
VRKSLDKLNCRLETLREASRRASKHILKKRTDIVAICVVGSVARGNIHENSDVDMFVLVESGDKPERESVQELDCKVDIVYIPFRLWKERLYRGIGSMWEIEVSNILDSLILYDRDGFIQESKREFKIYPDEKRRMSILHIFQQMGWFENTVKYHYLKKNYDIESVFSKIFAIEALRILFPLNRVYLKGDKYIFEQVKDLREKPPDFLEKCLSLLWFKSQNVNYNEATWIIDTVSEIMKIVEEQIAHETQALR